MMKTISDCTVKDDFGRCKELGHRCCFLPGMPLSACPTVKIEKPIAKKRGKEKK